MATKQDMKLIKGEVSRITHFSIDTGFLVFQIKLEAGGKVSNHTVSCVGNSDEQPELGSMLEVYGSFDATGKYGPQFKYAAFHVIAGMSSMGIARFVRSFAKFLGPEKSMALAQHFGSELEYVLEHEPDRLLEVDGIGEVIRDNIVEGWSNNKSVHSVKIFLSSIGLSDQKIRMIVAKHGHEYDAVIKSDPYVLMFEGLGFSVCDSISEKLNIPADSLLRLRGLILGIIRENTVAGEGNLYVTKKDILDGVVEFNVNAVPDRKISPLGIAWSTIQPAIDSLVKDGLILVEDDCFYTMDQYFFEARSAELLAELLNTSGDSRMKAKAPDDLVSMYEAHERIKIPGFAFSDKQADSIRSFVTNKTLIVTGPPGTGKTTIVKTFVRILDDFKIDYCLLAPTGIASKRLEQTTGKDAATIHRHMGFQGKTWNKNQNNQLSESVIIVDEFSMVDMELFYRLVSAVKKEAHLVFVGDVFQLPSVGPGNVLKDLIKSSNIKTIMLDKIHRQAETSDIILAANRIKDGDRNLDLFKVNNINADICFVKTNKDVELAEKHIVTMAKSFAGRKDITYQVITPRNEGDLSVTSINTLLQGALNPPGAYPNTGSVQQIHLSKDVVIRPGDKVIITKNNYNLGVFNGDVGLVRHMTSEVIRVDLISGDSVALPVGIAREMLKLGYAVTVHKCLPWDTRVVTPTGYRPIVDLALGDEVISGKGSVEKVQAVHKVGERPIVNIITRLGTRVPSTAEHRHLVRRGATEQFIEAGAIIPGDFLVLSRYSSFGGEVQATPKSWKSTLTKNRSEIAVPEYLSNELFWLMGVIIGDGSCSDTRDGNIEITKPSSVEVLHTVERVLANIGVHSSYRTKNNTPYSIIFSSVGLREILLGAGVDFFTAKHKCVPEAVWGANRLSRLHFLAGLIDTDGSVSKKKGNRNHRLLRYVTVSPQLAKGITLLISSLGYPSTVLEEDYTYLEKTSKKYCINVTSVNYSKLLAELPLINQVRKNSIQEVNVQKEELDTIPEVSSLLETIRVAIRSHQGLDPHKRVRSKLPSPAYRFVQEFLKRKKRRISYTSLCVVADELFTYGIRLHELDSLLSNNFIYSEVTHIEKTGTSPVVDIEVSGDHTFIAEGVVTHNSQGSEFSVVILPLLKSHGGMLLQRNLLYTALTRARKKVVVLGQESAIEAAIENDSIRNRNTHLADRLTKCMTSSVKNCYTRPLYDMDPSAINYKHVQRLLNPTAREFVPAGEAAEGSLSS